MVPTQLHNDLSSVLNQIWCYKYWHAFENTLS